ncbi:MAG: nitroreductase family protein [Candidatus Krumholzibacteria bacterium]|nr:nitroreductase family protein [Candidatus Krumholzibacteria bacterium]
MSDPSRYKSKPLAFERLSPEEMVSRARRFFERMRTRRSVRSFSDEPVPREAILNCIDAAAQAPSGANKQPWTFVLVTDVEVKKRIREAAEKEEHEHYHGRAPERWLLHLEPLGTDEHKPFLENAPALIVLFAQRHGATPEDQHYYVSESVGIAAGFLLAALHQAGLATLTHTPSPMGFLNEILGRPANERAYLVIPVGYPAKDCRVPDITRKKRKEYLEEV